MQVVLDTRGLHLSVRNACFSISNDNETHLIHPGRITSILVTAPCRISSPALLLAAENEIPVVICDNTGYPAVRMWSSMFLNTSVLRRRQYEFTQTSHALKWASELIDLKIEGQAANLKYLAGRKPAIISDVEEALEAINKIKAQMLIQGCAEASSKKQLLYIEAYAAARYWQLVGKKLPPPFTSEGRVKKQPPDGFNTCINYLYAVLRNHTETAVLSMGLDPALGIIHRDGYKLPSLVFDLMEPFRPVADRILISAILKKQLSEANIIIEGNSARLTREGRHNIIRLFNEKLHTPVIYRGKSALLSNHIISEAKLLAIKINSK